MFLLLKLFFHSLKCIYSHHWQIFNFFLSFINIFFSTIKINLFLLSSLLKVGNKITAAPNYIRFPTTKDILQVFSTTIRFTILIFLYFLNNLLYLFHWYLKINYCFTNFSNRKVVNPLINENFNSSDLCIGLFKLLTSDHVELVLEGFLCCYKVGVLLIELYDFYFHIKIFLIMWVVNPI